MDAEELAARNAAIESTGKHLHEVAYQTRSDRSRQGDDSGIVRGYWADGHNWNGAREFIPADGSASLYLFDDEIVSDEEAP